MEGEKGSAEVGEDLCVWWSMTIWCGKESCATWPCPNHPAWRVVQALGSLMTPSAAAPVCAQVKYNVIDRAVEGELGPAWQFGLSMVPFGPLHGGLLAGM